MLLIANAKCALRTRATPSRPRRRPALSLACSLFSAVFHSLEPEIISSSEAGLKLRSPAPSILHLHPYTAHRGACHSALTAMPITQGL